MAGRCEATELGRNSGVLRDSNEGAAQRHWTILKNQAAVAYFGVEERLIGRIRLTQLELLNPVRSAVGVAVPNGWKKPAETACAKIEPVERSLWRTVPHLTEKR